MYLIEIGIFGETPPPTMLELATFLTDLIGLADHLGLRQPLYTTVCDTGSIGLQLPPDMDSVQAVRTWAMTYNADVDETIHKDGQEIWVSTDFSFDDVNVTVYAHIPVPVEGPAETANDERLPF